MYPQSYPYGCWLAAGHSMVRHRVGGLIQLTYPIGHLDNLLTYHDSWMGPHGGLEMSGEILREFASQNGFGYQQIGSSLTPIIEKIVDGPVMVAGLITGVGIHFFVIHSVNGDVVKYKDPMPVMAGSAGTTTFQEFKALHPGAFQHMFWNK